MKDLGPGLRNLEAVTRRPRDCGFVVRQVVVHDLIDEYRRVASGSSPIADPAGRVRWRGKAGPHGVWVGAGSGTPLAGQLTVATGADFTWDPQPATPVLAYIGGSGGL